LERGEDLFTFISWDNSNKWGSKLSKAKLRKMDSKLVSMIVVSAEMTLTRTAMGMGGEGDRVGGGDEVGEDGWRVKTKKKMKRESLLHIPFALS
jgi:hypothetical protein